jgi:hypothetical protein
VEVSQPASGTWIASDVSGVTAISIQTCCSLGCWRERTLWRFWMSRHGAMGTDWIDWKPEDFLRIPHTANLNRDH